jgi:hypothetical protein
VTPSMEACARSVARKHHVRWETMVSRCNWPEVVKARQEWMSLVVDTWALSLSEASRLLGWDRDAIRNAIKKHRARCAAREVPAHFVHDAQAGTVSVLQALQGVA